MGISTFLAAGCGALLAAAAAQALAATPYDNLGPTAAELAAADTTGANWLTFNKGERGYRYSALTQLTPANVGQLALRCRFDTGEVNVPFRSGPVVYNGVMLVTTRLATFAIDANTCAWKWKHTWAPLDAETNRTNNGVALANGRVFRGTTDGHLLALDAATGKLLWQRRIMDANLGEYAVAAPISYNGLVYIGKAGGDLGIRGEIMAFRVADGSKAWGFSTIPAAGQPGAETWSNPASLAHGGGGTWASFSLDIASNTLLAPIGNPAPDFDRDVRPGRNLYTNSILALNAQTGALRWAYQLRGPEDRDWDTSVVSLVTNRQGRTVVLGAGKDGILHGFDYGTRATLFKRTIASQLATVERIPPAPGLRFCPIAAVQWNGPAYHPGLGLAYQASVDWCATGIDGPTPTWTMRQPYLGWANGYGTRDPISMASGWVNAVDMQTGAFRWRYHASRPLVAAVTVTAGNLLFTGDIEGRLFAMNATTGAVLRTIATGAPLGGGIVSYQAAGQQRLAVVSGFTSGTYQTSGRATVSIYGLPN